MITNIDYNWFYSSLSQSLAALIGIVGMVVIYRLEIQERNIREAMENLRIFLKSNFNKKCDSMVEIQLLQEALKEESETREKYQKYQKEIESKIDELNSRLNYTDSQKSMLKKNISDLEKSMDYFGQINIELKYRISVLNDEKCHRKVIRRAAFQTMLYISFLFLVSLDHLRLGDNFTYFFQMFKWHLNITNIIFFVFIPFGLFLLLRCCVICFDYEAKYLSNKGFWKIF